MNALRIVHVLRAPVGGLFRHVRDLVRGQSEIGHAVGLVCDSTTGGKAAEVALAELAPHCRLGVKRIKMSRLPGLGDVAASRATALACRELRPSLLHGHGAKGGLYARLAGKWLRTKAFYTPHGGSLHYEWTDPHGAIFLGAERAIRGLTAGFLFVCEYERGIFDRKIGLGGIPSRVVHNGLWPDDCAVIEPTVNATDLLFLGELRHLKGIGDLLEALALLNVEREVSLTIVGDGPDRAEFEQRSGKLGLGDHVRFIGAMPAHKAFPLGRIFVMPSRAESFPYVPLEVAAVGMPIIATAVGGIPEVLPLSDLVEPQNPRELAKAIALRLDKPGEARHFAADLRNVIAERYSARQMCTEIASFYEAVVRT